MPDRSSVTPFARPREHGAVGWPPMMIGPAGGESSSDLYAHTAGLRIHCCDDTASDTVGPIIFSGYLPRPPAAPPRRAGGASPPICMPFPVIPVD